MFVSESSQNAPINMFVRVPHHDRTRTHVSARCVARDDAASGDSRCDATRDASWVNESGPETTVYES